MKAFWSKPALFVLVMGLVLGIAGLFAMPLLVAGEEDGVSPEKLLATQFSPGQWPQDYDLLSTQLNISHVDCATDGSDLIEVHFVLVQAPNASNYGSVAYKMLSPCGQLNGTASFTKKTGTTVHYMDYVECGPGLYCVSWAKVTVGGETYWLANPSCYDVGPCGPTPTSTQTKTPTPTQTPIELACIGDYVWLDVNYDGMQGPDDVPVEGVTVNLYDSGGTFIRSMTTNADGKYLFCDLVPGDYYVKFIAPLPYKFSHQDQGLNDAGDSDADESSGVTIVVHLDPGDYDMAWDAGLVIPPNGGGIVGRKFWDKDGNGLWDDGEPTLAGFKIVVKNEAGQTVWEMETLDVRGDPHGSWNIPIALEPGIYTIREISGQGWIQTYPTGDGLYRIRVDGSGDWVLVSDEPSYGYTGDLDFGNTQHGLPTPTPPIGGPWCWVCPEWVVFQSDRVDGNANIFRMRFDGTEVLQLTDAVEEDVSPTWSFDGDRIAFASNRDGDWEIYRMGPAGGGQINVTHHPLAEDGVSPSNDLAPSWSCEWIAFQSDRDGNWEIYKTLPSGVPQIRLTDNPASDQAPNWSPDESWIAFQSDRDGNWEIYIMDADGGNLRRLTFNDAADRNPSWSTDGRWIAFDSDREGQFDIYKINVETGQIIRLTDDPGRDTDPAWMPYCEHIFFQTDRDQNTEVYRMEYDGSQQINLSDEADWFDALDAAPDPDPATQPPEQVFIVIVWTNTM